MKNDGCAAKQRQTVAVLQCWSQVCCKPVSGSGQCLIGSASPARCRMMQEPLNACWRGPIYQTLARAPADCRKWPPWMTWPDLLWPSENTACTEHRATQYCILLSIAYLHTVHDAVSWRSRRPAAHRWQICSKCLCLWEAQPSVEVSTDPIRSSSFQAVEQRRRISRCLQVMAFRDWGFAAGTEQCMPCICCRRGCATTVKSRVCRWASTRAAPGLADSSQEGTQKCQLAAYCADSRGSFEL